MDIFHQILKKYYGYSSFRPLQLDIIQSVYEGHDTLALMPTGGGKSITFQVPALAKGGTCLVVSPLIALMKDQVENLRKKGINAMAIHSGLTRREIDIALDNVAYGSVKFLYLSPERLGTELFLERLQKMTISMIAVDESHCVSQWGYDFRPSYLEIAKLREHLPDVPILAVTATATPEVADDICLKLNFKDEKRFQSSFERPNLAYVVRICDDKEQQLIKIANSVKGSGVVYVRNRNKTKEIATMLAKAGISADFYHAGLSTEMRNLKQDRWIKNQTRVIVATNAFGMGIDKPDVRFVVHMDVPDCVEAYFQEAGRGGRDLKKAYAVMLFSQADEQQARDRLEKSFPPIDELRRVYQALYSFYNIPYGGGKGQVYDFNLMEFCTHYRMSTLAVYNATQLLKSEGYLEVTDELDNPSRAMFTVSREDLYKVQVSRKELDAITKLLLRTYTGLFGSYANIDEGYLAKISGVNVQVVYELLKQLTKAGVISYIPRKKTPLIIFTEERLDDRNIRFSPENYRLRKERYQQRLNAMLDYCNARQCRNQQLLAYFGEKSDKPCGVCDVCLEKTELDLTHHEQASIKRDILKAIGENGALPNIITETVKFPPEKVATVLSWMIDSGMVEVVGEKVVSRIS